MSEFKFPAVLTEVDGFSTVTAYRRDAVDPIHTADSFHPFWNDILSGLRNGDPNVWDKFDVAGGIMRSFRQVTDRVSWDGETVLFDGDPINSVLANQLARALKAGDSDTYLALARFWEKLASNPDPHSREQAYNWLAQHDFQITLEGDVVGYKGMYPDERAEGDPMYRSSSRSSVPGKPSGFVNGVAIPERSTIPQAVGDVVTMPRSEVEHDPGRSCSRGLHVGDFSYGNSFASVTMEVTVNPVHIVSVPTDSGGRKLRVCQYTNKRIVDRATFKPASNVLHKENEVAESWSDVGYTSV